MSRWVNEEDWPLVDYGEISEEDEGANNYVIPTSNPSSTSTSESVIVIDTFHDPSLSSDHGRNAATASEGLEGLPMILTPSASPDLSLIHISEPTRPY